jgi:hypothetical protein
LLFHNSPLNALSKILGINVRPKSGRNSFQLADCNRPKAWAGSALTFARREAFFSESLSPAEYGSKYILN